MEKKPPFVFQIEEKRFNLARKAYLERHKGMQPEKIVDYNNLQQIAWLQEGLRHAESVGRIVTPEGLGTGWLIANDLLLTNNHVIDDATALAKSWVEFRYQIAWDGTPIPPDRYEFSEVLKTDPDLDYTIVRTKNKPGERYGSTRILDAKRPSMDSSASRYPVIIQHPSGGYKQISLTDNELVTFDDRFVWYTTDTEPGSSGSPVYDQLWRPFALHHAGGPKKLDDGKVVILNEGVILAAIVQHAKGVLGSSETLQSILGDLLVSGCFTPPAQIGPEWYLDNIELQRAIKVEARGNEEIAPLIAAAAGVAAGAAAAHWAHITSKERTEPQPEKIRLTGKISLDLSLEETDGPREIMAKIYSELEESNFQSMKGVTKEDPLHEAIPLAVAFLAGVAAGAAAYQKGK